MKPYRGAVSVYNEVELAPSDGFRPKHDLADAEFSELKTNLGRAVADNEVDDVGVQKPRCLVWLVHAKSRRAAESISRGLSGRPRSPLLRIVLCCHRET